MKLYLKDRKDLSLAEIRMLLELLTRTWPPQDGTIDMEKMIAGYQNSKIPLFNKVLLCFNGEELIGHTEIFAREVVVRSEKRDIMALAGVCVKHTFRGQNIGLQLVRKAFEFVDEGAFPCSIFQTNVPGFYEKVKCKQIQNKFINSKHIDDVNKNPWRDPFVMIYPETYDLGKEVVDLLGDGY